MGPSKKFHLKGMAVACEGLILYPDNRKVHKSFLVTCGKLEMAEFQLEAKHLWREALITIKLPPVDTCYTVFLRVLTCSFAGQIILK